MKISKLIILVVLPFYVSLALARATIFAKGADVSWVTQMEAGGFKFYNSAGTEEECMRLMKDLGMDSIRLRVWVNPAGGWSGENDVVRKAVRARKLGMRIMIDFHYSDYWADPGKQNKPATWDSHNIEQLYSDVSGHTTHVLNALKVAGIKPEWVQVGNETNDGMLWEIGRASLHMHEFAGLVTRGFEATKKVFPSAKVIVHLSNGYDNKLFREMFDGLRENGAKYDVIGMSLYPTIANWSTLTTDCVANMTDMVSRYDKEIMICEVGMDVDSPAIAKDFLADIIAKTKSLPAGKGLGVFYWEPECCKGWEGYKLGAFGSDGRPTAALDAFR